MTGNPSKVEPLCVPTLVGQTPDLCKVPPSHRSSKTPALPVGVAPKKLFAPYGIQNPDGYATKIKALTTWANPLEFG
jgi:hypothetical protein